MIQKTIQLCLLLSCIMPLHAEQNNPTLISEEISAQGTTRHCHHCLCTRELKVCCCATINNLKVLGNQTVSGNVTAENDQSIGGTLTVAGNKTVDGNVNVGGDLTADTTILVSGIDLNDVITGAENVCTGTTLFIGVENNLLQFKCLIAGDGITLTTDNNAITINATSTYFIEPIITTTTIGGILGYAGADNTTTTVIATGGNATFNLVEPSFSILPLIPDATSFTAPIGGTYYFQYIVRGSLDSALTPPAPLAFELTYNLLPIPGSQYASDTQSTSMGASGAGQTLAVKGYVVAELPAGAVIRLHNISGSAVTLTAAANKGGVAGPVASSATLIVERLT